MTRKQKGNWKVVFLVVGPLSGLGGFAKHPTRRVVGLVYVETLPLCLLVSRQVSSNGVNVWNVAPVSGGLCCMWVIESVLGHLPGLKMFFFSLTWMASLIPLSNQRSSLSSSRTWLS